MLLPDYYFSCCEKNANQLTSATAWVDMPPHAIHKVTQPMAHRCLDAQAGGRDQRSVRDCDAPATWISPWVPKRSHLGIAGHVRFCCLLNALLRTITCSCLL